MTFKDVVFFIHLLGFFLRRCSLYLSLGKVMSHLSNANIVAFATGPFH